MKQITPVSEPRHVPRQELLPPRHSDGRATRWDEHRNQRRDELILAARRAIHRGGPGVAMGDIAAEAATSKSVYYRYFGDKDGLRRAIGDDVVSKLSSAVQAAGRNAPDPLAALSAMIGTYLAQAEASPNTYAFVMAPGDAGQADALKHVSDHLAELFRERLQELNPGPSLLAQLSLWPHAALGFIRAAGEAWLERDAGEREGAAELTSYLTAWLISGPTSTPADAVRAVSLPSAPAAQQ
ncbi:TetR/AcrR family transcriptional regulator [Galactobacter valiniphilus]|uniref:TetR/AcrR family transcriptional regulator n=1 Tax=Galactobacter valiniphilus TaxID=2676122 RepID=UPI0013149E9C|nr:TetR/AcrR family transcriptional regulator [Galactobacter valiniphilus]